MRVLSSTCKRYLEAHEFSACVTLVVRSPWATAPNYALTEEPGSEAGDSALNSLWAPGAKCAAYPTAGIAALAEMRACMGIWLQLLLFLPSQQPQENTCSHNGV